MSKLILMTLTWNRLPMLATMRASIQPCLEGIDHEFYIKDNGSMDGTVNEVSSWPDVKLLSYPDNRQSFAEGMNYIFNKAQPADDDIVMLLNNDVEFMDHKSIHNMMSLMTDDVGVVGAKMVFTGTNRLQHAGVVFHEANQLPVHHRANQEDDELAGRNRYFQAVTGAIMMVRAGLYRKVCETNRSGISGMDETYQWMYEDIDLCMAVRAMGKKVVYCGQTNISHRESATLKENPVNRLFLNQNINHFRSRWHGTYKTDRQIYAQDPNYGLLK